MTTPPKAVLPSGRCVALTKRADPARPWGLSEAGGCYLLTRSHRGDSSRTEVYGQYTAKPMLLDQADGTALCRLLNANMPIVSAPASKRQTETV